MPEDWRKTTIVPLYKNKGGRNVFQSYRGTSLLSSTYKLEIDEKKILPDEQAGFRKNRSTMDKVYILILYHIIHKAKRRKDRLYACFVNFKAALTEKYYGKL